MLNVDVSLYQLKSRYFFIILKLNVNFRDHIAHLRLELYICDFTFIFLWFEAPKGFFLQYTQTLQKDVLKYNGVRHNVDQF